MCVLVLSSGSKCPKDQPYSKVQKTIQIEAFGTEDLLILCIYLVSQALKEISRASPDQIWSKIQHVCGAPKNCP